MISKSDSQDILNLLLWNAEREAFFYLNLKDIIDSWTEKYSCLDIPKAGVARHWRVCARVPPAPLK